MRKFKISLRKNSEGCFVVSLRQLGSDIARDSDEIDNLDDALEELNKLQREWYDELEVEPRNGDEWRIFVNVAI